MDFISTCLLLTLWNLISIPECSAGNHTEYKHPDVEGERDKARLIGICVGVGLAMMFLIVLCISYNYYKHKAQPTVVQDEPKSPKKPVTTTKPIYMVKLEEPVTTTKPIYMAKLEEKQVEQITQDTRF